MGVQERAIVGACPAPSPYALRNQKRNRYMGGLLAIFFSVSGHFSSCGSLFAVFFSMGGGGGDGGYCQYEALLLGLPIATIFLCGRPLVKLLLPVRPTNYLYVYGIVPHDMHFTLIKNNIYYVSYVTFNDNLCRGYFYAGSRNHSTVSL